jgi:hypothetical protein
MLKILCLALMKEPLVDQRGKVLTVADAGKQLITARLGISRTVTRWGVNNIRLAPATPDEP